MNSNADYIFETQRVYLRELSLHDAPDFFHLNNDENVLKYTGDVAFSTVEAAKRFLADYAQYRLNGFGRWAVIEKNTGNFIGWCGLRREPGAEEVDLGFRFFKKYWGQNFATEAALAALYLGFTKYHLPVIFANVQMENIASCRVLQKLGMHASHQPTRSPSELKFELSVNDFTGAGSKKLDR